jgi:hypothetical protein
LLLTRQSSCLHPSNPTTRKLGFAKPLVLGCSMRHSAHHLTTNSSPRYIHNIILITDTSFAVVVKPLWTTAATSGSNL